MNSNPIVTYFRSNALNDSNACKHKNTCQCGSFVVFLCCLFFMSVAMICIHYLHVCAVFIFGSVETFWDSSTRSVNRMFSLLYVYLIFPFQFRGDGFGFDCASFWSLLT